MKSELLYFALSTVFFLWVYFFGGAVWLYNREHLECLWNDWFYWAPPIRDPEDIKSLVLLGYSLGSVAGLLWFFFLRH